MFTCMWKTETSVQILTFPFASLQFPIELSSFNILFWMCFEHWTVIMGHGFEFFIWIYKWAIFSILRSKYNELSYQ